MAFQSTLPHGSDQPLSALSTAPLHFNPRSLTGATRISPAGTFALYHFNPRSLTGATNPARRLAKVTLYFNPRSLTGATVITFTTLFSGVLFQSTLPHGSDHYCPVETCACRYDFNPRSLTGATRCTRHNSFLTSGFQSTLPHGSDQRTQS